MPNEPMAVDLALLGSPYTAPVAIEVNGVGDCFGLIRATTASLLTLGNLVTMNATGQATLADQSTGVLADHIIVRVENASSVYVAQEADISLTLSGFPTTGIIPIYLGESGGFSQTPGDTLSQLVGSVKKYDASTGKHRCAIRFSPQSAMFGG